MLGNKDIIWTVREAGQAVSQGRFDPKVSVVDHSLSPDWIVLPDAGTIPKELRGRRCKVGGSLWLDFAPNPEPTKDAPWLDQPTRWHVVEECDKIAIAEVAGQGWVVVCIVREMYVAMLKECVTQLEMQLMAGDCEA